MKRHIDHIKFRYIGIRSDTLTLVPELSLVPEGPSVPEPLVAPEPPKVTCADKTPVQEEPKKAISSVPRRSTRIRKEPDRLDL